MPLDLLKFSPAKATPAEAIQAQKQLAALDYYKHRIDGDFAKESRKALDAYVLDAVQKGTPVLGDGTWPWYARRKGDDLLLYNVKATAFGGSNDSMDGGSTASGYSTKNHPGLIACSLPMRNDTMRDGRGGYALRGSPIPKLPFGLLPNGKDNPGGARVDVTFLGSGLTAQNVPVIDIGPAKWTGNALDCSVALARLEQRKATANNFSAQVNVRIIGAAKSLPLLS